MRIVGSILVVAVSLSLGCSGQSGDRLEVTGEVTFAGNPLPNGSISFVSIDSGTSAGASLEDGTFRIPLSRGPEPGSYRVEIVSYQGTGEMSEDPDTGEPAETLRQVVPGRYNEQSELVVQISSSDDNEFEFALTP